MEKVTEVFDWEKERRQINANMDKLFSSQEKAEKQKTSEKDNYELFIRESEDLIKAVQLNNLKNTRKYLAAGGKVNHQSQLHNRSPIQYAVMNANIDIAKVLIEHGAEIDMQGKYGSPIHDLLHTSHWCYTTPTLQQKIDMIKFLFTGGAKIDYRDGNGDTYLHKAIDIGSLELVKLILEQPGGEQLLPIKNYNGTTIVMACILRNQLDIFKYFISLSSYHIRMQLAVCGPECFNIAGCLKRLPPLLGAILLGHTDFALYIIDLIVSWGAHSPVKLNSRFMLGYTALHIAALACDVDVIAALLPHENIDIEGKMFLKHGIKYDPFDYIFFARGPTGLFGRGDITRCIEILVQANADTSRRLSPHERPPLVQLTVGRSMTDVSKFLILAGAPVDHLNDAGSGSIIDIEDNDLRQWILEFYRNPRSLQDLCRISVRRQLGKEIRFTLPLMPLPTSIKEYLMLGDLCFVELNEQHVLWKK